MTITTSQKKGKKIVTTVSGLKGYGQTHPTTLAALCAFRLILTLLSPRPGVNLKDAASVFKKKFASGASVTKEGDVDIQVGAVQPRSSLDDAVS